MWSQNIQKISNDNKRAQTILNYSQKIQKFLNDTKRSRSSQMIKKKLIDLNESKRSKKSQAITNDPYRSKQSKRFQRIPKILVHDLIRSSTIWNYDKKPKMTPKIINDP